MPRSVPLCFISSVVLVAMLVAGKASADEPGGSEIVLFPFDDYSIPFNKGLILTLIPGQKSNVNPSLGIDPKHPSKPVLAIGKEGDPDFPRAYFCGTVLFVDGEYRMWYSGFSNDGRRQVCYAVSKNGIQWKKPKLGLAEYRGNKDNNLVGLDDGQPVPGMIVLVLHDPEDPDPARRFKMIREVNPATILAAVSADGLRWRSLNNNEDVIAGKSNLEPTGFIRHNGGLKASPGVEESPDPGKARPTLPHSRELGRPASGEDAALCGVCRVSGALSREAGRT